MGYKEREIEILKMKNRVPADMARERENLFLLIAESLGFEEKKARTSLFEPDVFCSLCVSAILDLRRENETLLKTVEMLQGKLADNNWELLSFWGTR